MEIKIKIGSEVHTTVPMSALYRLNIDGVKIMKQRSMQVKKGSVGTVKNIVVGDNFYVEFKSHFLVLHKDCIKLVEEN